MQAIKLGEDQFRITISPADARILINSMKTTFRTDSGEGIRTSEYYTRIGSQIDDVKAIISQIEAALAS